MVLSRHQLAELRRTSASICIRLSLGFHQEVSITSPVYRITTYAWIVVAVLLPVALLNYLDRQMLATMKASMVSDIPGIANKADWGLVLGCFKWTYAILSPFGGFIADRVSRRLVIGLSLLVWSLVTWWTGHVTSFHELMTARALMGISEAFYIPAALALITDFHPGSTRSRAVGIPGAPQSHVQLELGYSGEVLVQRSRGPPAERLAAQ